jgi:DNA repair exonuclease SbcCD ATPase subunit
MINFSVIRYKNFLSSGNSFTEIILNRSLDALSFALYGKPFRRINKPQLLNSINQKNLEVEVEFKIGKNEYKIIRGMKPNKFVIFKNNKEIDQDASVRDYQDFLEKNILKLNHKSFSQIVVLGSSTFVPFMQLPAQHRREVIEDLLDIQIFSTMNTLLKEKQSINKTDLLDVDYKIQLTEEKIEMQWNHIKELQKNNEKIINEYSTKISNSQIQKRKLQKQNIDLQKEIESWSQDVLELDVKKYKKKYLNFKV